MIKRESIHQWDLIPTDDDPATYDPTFGDFVCIVDAFEASIASPRVLLDDVTLPSDGGERISSAIADGTAGVVSDGSFDPDGRHCSSSFTMAATQDADEERLDGSNYVTRSAEDQSAYRSELAGIIGVLATVAILVKQFSITSSAITIALDGESALDEASGTWPLQIDQPCFDFLQISAYQIQMALGKRTPKGERHP